MADQPADPPDLGLKIVKNIEDEMIRQLQTNTDYLNKLKGLLALREIKVKYGGAKEQDDESTEAKVMTRTSKKMDDIIEDLQNINKEIAVLVARLHGTELPTGFRDSTLTTSSGICSDSDPTENLTPAVQDLQPHDPWFEKIPMRPASEYFMERQGAASLTPRRGVGTRTRQPMEREDPTEEEPTCSSSSNES